MKRLEGGFSECLLIEKSYFLSYYLLFISQVDRPSENKHSEFARFCFQTAFIYRLRMGLTAYAFDFCTYAAEFFLDVFIAAVEVVDAFDDGFAICD